MRLAQAPELALAPGPIMGAELGIAVGGVAVGGRVLLPQQQQSHTLAPELGVDRGEIRPCKVGLRSIPAPALEAALELIVVEVARKRPAQVQLPGPTGVFGDHPFLYPPGPSHLLVAQAGLELQTENLASLAHG
jgi:hypothetical protein